MINLTENVSYEQARNLAKATAVDELCASLLIARGYGDAVSAKKFLYGSLKDLTSPYEYKGMEEAVAAIRRVIAVRGKIVLYGDYDCDGIGAVSILTRAFKDVGIKTDFYIPIRAEEGYGLNCEALDKIKEKNNPDLIITVDCGVTSVKEVDYAKEIGVDIIVTDHHKIGEALPSCPLVNPCLNPELTQLCGAGVALMLARALFGDDIAFQYLDICALSTIADIVPLTGDNRIIVKYGLKQIRMGVGNCGIKELIAVAGLDRRYIGSYDIAFKLAPRLNAAGRLKTAYSSVKLLTSDDLTETRFLSEELSMQNTERQNICSEIADNAMNMLRNYEFGEYKVIVLCNREWNEGVIGIAAARLAEYFNLPCILFTEGSDGRLKGSARSIAGVNIYDAISTQRGLLTTFGGHAMAAGLSLKRENFDSFKDGLNAAVRALPNDVFIRKTCIDGEFSIKNITETHIKNIELLEPFGFKNPAPIFCDVQPEIKFDVMKKAHLKGRAKIGDAVCFGKAELLPAYTGAESRALIYTVGKNRFNGREYNEIKIRSMLYDGFSVPNELLFERFAEFSLKVKGRESINAPQKKGGAAVHVFFNQSDYNAFCADNPDIKRLFASVDSFEFVDTAVLSPSPDFPFEYFGRIVLHGSVTDDIYDYFRSLGAQAVSGSRVCLADFDIEEMRNTYTTLRNRYGKPCKFTSLNEVYKLLEFDGYALEFEKFLLHFYIMTDVELLKILNGDILTINYKKADLEASSLYRYVNGRSVK